MELPKVLADETDVGRGQEITGWKSPPASPSLPRLPENPEDWANGARSPSAVPQRMPEGSWDFRGGAILLNHPGMLDPMDVRNLPCAREGKQRL